MMLNLTGFHAYYKSRRISLRNLSGRKSWKCVGGRITQPQLRFQHSNVIGATTMMATNHDDHMIYHDGHINENVKN